jgi:phytoene synthase
MHDAYAHCEALVRETDKDRYLAALFIPAAARRHVFALYAFDSEIAAVRGRIREPMTGEVRLQWWRDTLAGKAAGEAAGHPVAAALLDTVRRCELPIGEFERMLEARAFDLYPGAMPSREAFDAYLHATASTVFALAGKLLGGNGATLGAGADSAGLAYGITGLLRALPLHASRGQIYLPGDLLDRHNADGDLILRGKGHAGLSGALAELRRDARAHLTQAHRLMPDVPEKARAAFLPLALVEPYLKQMERRDYDPFRPPVEIPQWRRQWLLWRAARTLR